jgi:hypothetical protein
LQAKTVLNDQGRDEETGMAQARNRRPDRVRRMDATQPSNEQMQNNKLSET